MATKRRERDDFIGRSSESSSSLDAGEEEEEEEEEEDAQPRAKRARHGTSGEGESVSSSGAALRERLRAVQQMHLGLQPGESLVTVAGFPKKHQVGEDADGQPVREEHVPRADGVITRIDAQGNERELEPGQMAFGAAWRREMMERSSILVQDPMYVFANLLAGATASDVTEMYDETSVRNATTYDREMAAWNKAERERIMVDSDTKQKQIEKLEKSLEARRAELYQMRAGVDVLNSLVGPARFMGAQLALVAQTGLWASAGLCYVVFSLRERVANIALEVHAAGASMGLKAPYNGAQRVLAALYDTVVLPARKLLGNVRADGFFEKYIGVPLDNWHKPDGAKRTWLFGEMVELMRAVEWYLFVRDFVAPRETYVHAGAVVQLGATPSSVPLSVADLLENTLVATASVSAEMTSALKPSVVALASRLNSERIDENSDLDKFSAVLRGSNYLSLVRSSILDVVGHLNSVPGGYFDRNGQSVKMSDKTAAELDEFFATSSFPSLPLGNAGNLSLNSTLKGFRFTYNAMRMKDVATGLSIDWLCSFIHWSTRSITIGPMEDNGFLSQEQTDLLYRILVDSYTAYVGELLAPLEMVARDHTNKELDLQPGTVASLLGGLYFLPFQQLQDVTPITKAENGRGDDVYTLTLLRGAGLSEERRKLIRETFPFPDHIDTTVAAFLGGTLDGNVTIQFTGIPSPETAALFKRREPTKGAGLPFILATLATTPWNAWFNTEVVFKRLKRVPAFLAASAPFIGLQPANVFVPEHKKLFRPNNKDTPDTYKATQLEVAYYYDPRALFLVQRYQHHLATERLPHTARSPLAWTLLVGYVTKVLEFPAPGAIAAFLSDFVFTSQGRIGESVVGREYPLRNLLPNLRQNTNVGVPQFDPAGKFRTELWQKQTALFGEAMRQELQNTAPHLYIYATLAQLSVHVPTEKVGEVEQQIGKGVMALDAARTELLRLTTGGKIAMNSQQDAVRALYVPPPAWQMRPEIAGAFRLSAEVVHALEEALAVVRAHVPTLAQCSLDDLTQAPVASGLPGAFARLVAALLNEHRLAYPRQYHKDMQYKRAPKIRQDALNALREFSSRGTGAQQVVTRRDASGRSQTFHKR